MEWVSDAVMLYTRWTSNDTAQLYVDNRNHHEGLNCSCAIILLLWVAVSTACTVWLNR
jgi:hypothetical protein